MAKLIPTDEPFGETDSEENKKRGWKLELAKGKKTTNVDIWKNNPKQNV